MFNFKTLKLDRREDLENTNSFVGIRKNENNEMEFRLPRGFENFPDNDFVATKNLFFKMYRTFKKFEQDSKSLQLDERETGKDNIETGGNGYQFKDKEDNEVVLYSKISVIENLLEAYHDLALDVIERRSGRNEEIDYSKIDKYLHKATYLDEDVIYIDEMELPRHFLQYQSATLIDLFCFILHELENELEQESGERVNELAHRFKDQYLIHDQYLFDEETFEATITALKDSLDTIDKVTAYKDEDYWQLYEAIESFLYGELDMKNTHDDGIFWGISNFYQIWEDMCNTYAFSAFDVIYADTNIVFNGKNVANCSFGGRKIFKKESFDNPFFIEFRGEKRWMRPDLVISEIHDEKPPYFIYNENIKITPISIASHSYKSEVKFNTIDFKISLINTNDGKKLKNIIKKLKKKSSQNSNINNVKFNNYKFSNYNIEIFESFFGETIKYNKCSKIEIYDWKYMDHSDFYMTNKKLEEDISKQLCYELSIYKNSFKLEVKSEFVIPFFYHEKLKSKDEIGYFVEDKKLYDRLQKNNIIVFKANFKKIQEIYLNHD